VEVQIANNQQRLAESLAAGEVRMSKRKVTLMDRVFAALAEGHFNGNRLTAEEVAAKAGTTADGAQATMVFLRLLGFRINVALRHIVDDDTPSKAHVHEYWFAAADEEDVHIMSNEEVQKEDVTELTTFALSLLAESFRQEKERAK
jgi:hypothetical protein